MFLYFRWFGVRKNSDIHIVYAEERNKYAENTLTYKLFWLLFYVSFDWKPCTRQLDDNALRHLDDISLAQIGKSLRALQIEGNMLQRVPTEALTGLPTLEILWVSLYLTFVYITLCAILWIDVMHYSLCLKKLIIFVFIDLLLQYRD